MCEGPSMISGPIPPDPTLFPEYYKRPSSARGRLEGNTENGSSTLLKGPLAPDPVLFPGCYSARSTPRPRIGPNAAHILERGQRGVVGNLLKLEGVSLNPNPTKPKPAARDFGKENVRKLREIQRRFRELEAQREHAKPVPVKALWISPKYQDVPSRVMAQLQEMSPPEKTECQNFLKAHSLCGRPQLSRSDIGQAPGTAADSDSEMEVRGRTVDFVSHNARAVRKTTLRRSQSLQNLREKTPPSAVKGKVPQYLEQRKEHWKKEAEERRKNTPDPSIPDGHTQMSERERQETLQSLKETHRSLVNELLSLPVKSDTLSIRSRRAELDQRLSEVEEAIKIFSRDKVYVKINS
ncbi:enkurin domain-containing protein 1 [Myxocyprinus asiaticus]|uniref:enkurin domain-containing protein 1 n=1 Tax=Myxocyprinus asiaticus TaxID=70543 RepID=UPI0022218D79|nr:enkurin domain-containing protein 1 [Myxocyprinus asiaticus]XP_051509211.1 enkurin domain-containing protein 1 [Myxocyprinus asiaticus]XP_051509212.1 enkurin domain-containing protein 1 [Myxocyprinus asiaticus]